MYKNLQQTTDEDVASDVTMAGYDPVASFVAELQAEYGHLALFFYDSYGGKHIGVMFNPGALQPCAVRVPDLADRLPHGSKVCGGIGWWWGSSDGSDGSRWGGGLLPYCLTLVVPHLFSIIRCAPRPCSFT